MTAMVALACMGMTVSCDKINDDSNSLVGQWRVDNMTYDGRDMTPEDMVLVMNADGTGDVLTNGHSDNDSFTWSVSGDILTVYPNGGSEYTFTIVSISSTEASLTGNVVPGTDMTGNVTMHLTKISGGGDNPDPQPGNEYSTLILGSWQVTTALFNGQDMAGAMGSLILSFNAGGTGLINHNGVTENNDFGWSISGNTITITPHGGSFHYTIVTLDATTCNFTGTVFPITEQQGEVDITMSKL